MSLDTEPREAGLLPQQKESVCPAGEKHNSETEIRHNPKRHNSDFFFKWAELRIQKFDGGHKSEIAKKKGNT